MREGRENVYSLHLVEQVVHPALYPKNRAAPKGKIGVSDVAGVARRVGVGERRTSRASESSAKSISGFSLLRILNAPFAFSRTTSKSLSNATTRFRSHF